MARVEPGLGWASLFGRLLLALFLVLTLIIFAAINAFAQAATAEPTTISFPWGQWLNDGLTTILSIAGIIIAWAMRKLPARVADFLITMKAEQLLQRAIEYGLNAVAGASKDKVLTVDVGNAVIAKAAQYAIDHGPGWLISWLGGKDKLKEMIVARLELPAEAGASGGKLIE